MEAEENERLFLFLLGFDGFWENLLKEKIMGLLCYPFIFVVGVD